MEFLEFVILFAVLGLLGAIVYWVFSLALMGVGFFIVGIVLLVIWNLLS